MPEVKFLIHLQEENQRLDLFLSARIEELSRSKIQRLIAEGHVLINGHITKPSYNLKAGDKVEMEYETREPQIIRPENIPLNIIYSDEHILVVDKPSGVIVHPGAGVWKGTLVNALLHHFPDLEGIGPAERPGIVHRLDKETSGVMVVAKSLKAYECLQQQFKDREVEKIYTGLIFGRIPQKEGVITWPIGRHPKHGERISTKTKKPRTAETHYTVEKELEEFTLLQIKPITGRTHQIRVHLAAAGHPVVGDSRYGRGKTKRKCPRLFLHASYLAFTHPDSGERVEFSAPLPEELTHYLQKVRACSE